MQTPQKEGSGGTEASPGTPRTAGDGCIAETPPPAPSVDRVNNNRQTDQVDNMNIIAGNPAEESQPLETKSSGVDRSVGQAVKRDSNKVVRTGGVVFVDEPVEYGINTDSNDNHVKANVVEESDEGGEYYY